MARIRMLSVKQMALYFGCLVILFLPVACDEKQDPYPGFSNLVAERHEVRKSISKERQGEIAKNPDAKEVKELKTENSTTVVFEKQIEITDSVSGKPIAKGVAYVNKNGKITRIRIYNQ